ncbi:MAG TPA: molybdopterin cofactor-binding domain-containing protein [Planctomycetaceae bacterium]|nr:molybdopterin cofactor-binding domain-containing protein [Planctomycetaceae bacterium]
MTRIAKRPQHLSDDCESDLNSGESLLSEPERYELREEPRYRFEVDRRDFLKTLGGGIVVCLVAGVAKAQRPARRGGGGRGGRGRSTPQELQAWLHINESGEVTACTGKVEIGQNIRTSLTQAVAEELRLPPARIRLIMADTDLVPYDFGTAGSMTTRMMSPQLRKAAATLRDLLLDLGAKELSVDRGTLAVSDGKVSHAATNRALSFGELAKKAQLTKKVSGDVALTPPAEWKTAGTSLPKVDGAAIVTGRHEYASDVRRPGMLFGKVLRPESLHAKLVSVDLEKAKALPGVTVVHDGDFVGVAAPTLHTAEQALAAVTAKWKTETTVSDAQLFEDLKKSDDRDNGGAGFGGRSNYSRGKIADGMKAADHKLQATYTISYIAHVPLEPRATVAEWNDGKLTVWTGTQMPFRVRNQLAQAFGLADEKVRVIVPDMGSGYGGKHTGEAAVEAARLAKAAGKPVKLNWTRQEEFTWGYFRPAGLIEVSAGVRKDGTITAWEFHNYNSGGSAIRPLYEIPHQRVAFHPSDGPLRPGSYRALAATANHFARESHLDDLAHAAGIDPLALRLKNLTDERLRAVLEAAAKKFGWGPQNKPSPGRGFGLACGSEKGSYVATCAEVSIDSRTGKVHVVRAVTAFECGAIINPDHLTNQCEGAVMMGLGGALFEAIRFDEDKIRNPKLSLYRVPRFADLPVLETVLVDRKDLPSVGAGETPIVAIAPAVGNAIFHATGKRLTSMPMVPRGLKI